MTAMSRCAPVGYGRAPPSGSISMSRTSLATSRAARTRPGPKCLVAAIAPDQGRAGQALERPLAAQDDLEVAPRQAGVLAGERLGARALAMFDRLEHPAVLDVGDVQDAVRFGQLGLEQDERAGRGEREREHPGVRGVERAAAGQPEQERVEALVELDVALEGLD